MTKNRAQLCFQLPLMELKSLKNRAQVVNKLSFVELKSVIIKKIIFTKKI